VLNGSGGIDLAAYLAAPVLVARLSRAEQVELLIQVKTLESALLIRLLADPSDNSRQRKSEAPEPEPDDRMLTVDEAAVILRKDTRWIYRRKKRLPFVHILSERSLLCSEHTLRQWIKQHQS
jgi:hypothetical protein